MQRPGPIALCLLALLSGCVSPGYDYGTRARTENDLPLKADEAQIERGRPIPILDGVGWIVGIPSKVMLLSTRVDNHFVSHGTEQSLQEYLDANDLDRVKVRLNQYAPLDEWRRLRGNKSVAPGWRYTLGTIATLTYTLVPGRITGGDHYNPFTNTVNIYSDHPAIALHEAGHAKDFSRRQYKGTWAAAYLLPGVALRHEQIATSDALSFLASEGLTGEQQEAYKILYPAYGSHIAGQVNNFAPPPSNLAITAACVIPGHLIGHWKASHVEPAGAVVEPAPSPALAATPGYVRLGDDLSLPQRPAEAPTDGFTEK
ncbi:hypothetical protein GC176_01360 [bacterium]|nr:hypothetical protein [bacterium]